MSLDNLPFDTPVRGINPLTISPSPPEIQAELQRLEYTLQELSSAVCQFGERLAPVLSEPRPTAAPGEVHAPAPSTPLGQYVRALEAQAYSTLSQLRALTGRVGF